MKTKPDLNRILYFVTVVECNSFTKAAQRLSIPKSTLSRHIQALESDINLRLLNRSTRQISLTKVGEEYYQSCLPLITELNKAQAKLVDYQNDVQGQLKVTMAVEVGTSLLAEILPTFIERFPKIKLEIHFSTDNHNLIEEGFDLAIRIGQQLEDSSYIATRIATPNLSLFASPNYLRTAPQINHLDDLQHHQHVLMNMSKGHLHLKDQPPFIRENFQLSSNSMSFNKQLCLANMGIALLPTILCLKEIQRGQLVKVLPILEIERPNMYAVYPSRNHQSKAFNTFLTFIRDEIKKSDLLN